MKRLVALASLLIVALPVGLAAAPAAGSSHRAAATSSFTGDAARIRGHGELAAISSDRRLYLLGGKAQGVHMVALADPAYGPLWSHDGRWLAVTTRPDPPASSPNADEPTTVWLVSTVGDVVRRLTPKGEDVYHAAAAWSPRADKIAVEYTAGVDSAAGPIQRLDVVDTSGNATSLASAQNISGFAWAPNGRRIAVGLNHFENSPGKWNSRLVTFAANGGGKQTVTTDVGDVLEVAGWWPDGSGVLTWLDYQGSASLAADGLPLLDIRITSGHRRQLGKGMLQYPGWLATSKLRNKVAFIAGGDRILTGGHKHLRICSRAHCRSVMQPAHKVTFDPAWSVDGQLAAVRDQAIKPTNGDYLLDFTEQVDASGGVDVMRNGHLRPVAGAEQGTAEAWGTAGSLLFVRGTSLWLLRPDTTHAHRVAGPLDTSANFYGFVNWWDSFAWSDAVPDVGRLGTPQVI